MGPHHPQGSVLTPRELSVVDQTAPSPSAIPMARAHDAAGNWAVGRARH